MYHRETSARQRLCNKSQKDEEEVAIYVRTYPTSWATIKTGTASHDQLVRDLCRN